ncbi:MAG: hypothetical protein ACPGC8_00040 [Flavobacteriaceae bacterium]|mgnify:CR=1 FL=1
MKNLILCVVICTATPLLSQTKLSHVYSVSVENTQLNREIIQENFGPAKQHKNTYIWEKYGPAYHYKIRLKPRKVIIRYTGKAKQMERKIKALRKRILH